MHLGDGDVWIVFGVWKWLDSEVLGLDNKSKKGRRVVSKFELSTYQDV